MFGRRIAGIGDEVDEHLMKLPADRFHVVKIVSVVANDHDVCLANDVLAETHGFFDYGIERDGLRFFL